MKLDKIRSTVASSVVGPLALAAALMTIPVASHAADGTVTPAFSEAIPNIPGKSLIAVVVDYPPGGKTPASIIPCSPRPKKAGYGEFSRAFDVFGNLPVKAGRHSRRTRHDCLRAPWRRRASCRRGVAAGRSRTRNPTGDHARGR